MSENLRRSRSGMLIQFPVFRLHLRTGQDTEHYHRERVRCVFYLKTRVSVVDPVTQLFEDGSSYCGEFLICDCLPAGLLFVRVLCGDDKCGRLFGL